MVRSKEERKGKNSPSFIHSFIHRGSDVSSFSPPFDVVVAAECIYFPELIPSLLQTMLALSDSHTELFVAFEQHNVEGVERFWHEAPALFEVARIERSQQHPMYGSDRITLLRMRMKQQ
jgi:hypothetical protein